MDIRALKVFFCLVKDNIKYIVFGQMKMSARVYKSRLDKKAKLRQNVRFYGSEIGQYSYVSRNCLVQGTNIGSFCSISENCIIGAPEHPLTMVSTSPVFINNRNVFKKNLGHIDFLASGNNPTVIGNDVWIGVNVVIKAGVRIGNGAVLGAGAIVTHDIPDYAIAVGVPARVVKFRFSEKEISELLKTEWWTFSENKLKSIGNSFENVNIFLNNECIETGEYGL